MNRRQIILIVMLAAAVSTAAGTGSFSAVNADRNVDVAVAADENAYLGIDVKSAEGYVGGESFTILELTDRFPGDLKLDSVTPYSDWVTIVDEPTDIGDSTPVTARCTGVGEDVSVTIEAASSDSSVVVERTIPVDCDRPEVANIVFHGCGNAVLKTADGSPYPVSITVEKRVYHPGSDSTTTTTEEIDNGMVSPGDGKLLAVKVNGSWIKNENQCIQIENEHPGNGNGNPSNGERTATKEND